jgi:hypothetical protein
MRSGRPSLRPFAAWVCACSLACVRLARGRALGGPRGLAMVVLHFGICRSAVAGCTERGREHEARVRTVRPCAATKSKARQAHPPRLRESKQTCDGPGRMEASRCRRGPGRSRGTYMGSPPPTSAPGLGSPDRHLHRGTGLTPPAHCSHICTGPGRRFSDWREVGTKTNTRSRMPTRRMRRGV